MSPSAILSLLCLPCAAPPPGGLPPSRELAPGIHALGASDRYGSANAGWVAFADHVILIGAPHPDLAERCWLEAGKISGKPVRAALLTHLRRGEIEAARFLVRKGVALVAQEEAAGLLRSALARDGAGTGDLQGARIETFADRWEFQDAAQKLRVVSLGHAAGPGDAAAFVESGGVLFTGEVCSHGPRAALAGGDTARWIRALEETRRLGARTVVPGFGSIGGATWASTSRANGSPTGSKSARRRPRRQLPPAGLIPGWEAHGTENFRSPSPMRRISWISDTPPGLRTRRTSANNLDLTAMFLPTCSR